MSLANKALEKFVLPLVIIFLTPLIASLGSRVVTGNWVTWINSIPIFIWIIFVALIVIWLIAIAINNRYKKIHKTVMMGTANFLLGGDRIEGMGDLHFAGVIWKVFADRSHWWDNPANVPIENIGVYITPRCPIKNCNTELEEKKNLLTGYTWACPRCGFKKWDRNNFATESERAAKIARSEIERERRKN